MCSPVSLSFLLGLRDKAAVRGDLHGAIEAAHGDWLADFVAGLL